MRITDRGTVFSGRQDTRRRSCAFPSIAALDSGRWICAFRAAATKDATAGQHTLLTWSDDRGGSWSDPIAPFSPLRIEGKPGLIRSAALTALGAGRVLAALCWVDHSDPALPFFNEHTEGLLDTRVLLSHSEDDGETWSEPLLIDTSPINVPMPITGPILVLPNADLACQIELNKHYDDTAPWHHRSVMLFSSDEGRTWPEYTVVTEDPENRIFYWDQRPAVLTDGCVLNFFWTYDTKAAVYRTIHAGQSSDNGRTWSAPWDTQVPGQPAQPVPLPDGRIAMVYVDRSATPCIKLRMSPAVGRTWPEDTEMVLYESRGDSQTVAKATMQDAWAEMGKFSVGLPATAGLPAGGILVVYYAGPHTDLTDIQWVRLQSE